MVIAALCHDLGHRGRNNGFEINTLSNLAIRYHDNSVLEQYHAALTMKLMMTKEFNILGNLEGSEFRNIRAVMIECILATDMKEHFDMIKEVSTRATELQASPEAELSDEDVQLAYKLCTHMSDLSGSAKRFDISQKWSKMVCEEFTQQVRGF